VHAASCLQTVQGEVQVTRDAQNLGSAHTGSPCRGIACDLVHAHRINARHSPQGCRTLARPQAAPVPTTQPQRRRPQWTPGVHGAARKALGGTHRRNALPRLTLTYIASCLQAAPARVTELQRLRAAVDAVHAAAAVVPARAYVADARAQLVANPLFAGVPYPAKLESYLHAQARPPAAHPRPGVFRAGRRGPEGRHGHGACEPRRAAGRGAQVPGALPAAGRGAAAGARAAPSLPSSRPAHGWSGIG